MIAPRIVSPDTADHPSARHPMMPEACARLLREIGWGVLAVAEHGRDGAVPVGVPTAYAFDGDRLYLAMATGRKQRALEQNPSVCLTVTDVRSLTEWRSVVVIGRPRWITAPSERSRVIATFAAQARPHEEPLSGRDIARLVGARLLALETQELHGFASGSGASAPPADARHRADTTAWPTPGAALGTRSAAATADDPRGRTAADPGSDAAVHMADAMDAIRRMVRALRVTDDASEATLGVSGAQLFVLRALEKAGATTTGELARRTATAQSTVSEVVTRLVARGLVTRRRSTSDRRRTVIALSEAGRELLTRAPETVQERMLAGFQQLAPEQQRRTAEGLAEWLRASGLGDLAATMFFEPLLERS